MSDQDESAKTGASRSVQAIAAKAETLFPDDEVPREALPLLRRAGIGRAKGAGNKRTEAMRELYLRMGYTHPMLWLGEILSRPVAELAKELQCKAIEALDEQRKAAADLLPYMESRRPLQIHDDRERSPNVLIVGDVRSVIAAERQAAAGGAMAIDDDVIDAVTKHVENQPLSTPRCEPGAQQPGHDTTQAVDNTSENGSRSTD
jgi:hypothetical protein